MNSNERTHFGQNLKIKQTIICILDELFQLFNKQNENYDPVRNINHVKNGLNKYSKSFKQTEPFGKFIQKFKEKVNFNLKLLYSLIYKTLAISKLPSVLIASVYGKWV